MSDGCGGTNSLGAAMAGTVATAAKVAGTAPGGSWEVAMVRFGEQIPAKKRRTTNLASCKLYKLS